ncbi:MAG: alpha/beta hydrolase [Halanaerobiales bacterium]
MTQKPIQVLSIYGGNDGITSLKKIDNSRDNLPDDTEYIEIKRVTTLSLAGMAFKMGIKKARISREKKQALIIDTVRKFLSDMTTGEDLEEDVENES